MLSEMERAIPNKLTLFQISFKFQPRFVYQDMRKKDRCVTCTDVTTIEDISGQVSTPAMVFGCSVSFSLMISCFGTTSLFSIGTLTYIRERREKYTFIVVSFSLRNLRSQVFEGLLQPLVALKSFLLMSFDHLLYNLEFGHR